MVEKKIYIVKMFGPPSLLRKQVFSTENKQKNWHWVLWAAAVNTLIQDEDMAPQPNTTRFKKNQKNIENAWTTYNLRHGKVRTFWEAHRVWKNLHVCGP